MLRLGKNGPDANSARCFDDVGKLRRRGLPARCLLHRRRLFQPVPPGEIDPSGMKSNEGSLRPGGDLLVLLHLGLHPAEGVLILMLATSGIVREPRGHCRRGAIDAHQSRWSGRIIDRPLARHEKQRRWSRPVAEIARLLRSISSEMHRHPPRGPHR